MFSCSSFPFAWKLSCHSHFRTFLVFRKYKCSPTCPPACDVRARHRCRIGLRLSLVMLWEIDNFLPAERNFLYRRYGVFTFLLNSYLFYLLETRIRDRVSNSLCSIEILTIPSVAQPAGINTLQRVVNKAMLLATFNLVAQPFAGHLALINYCWPSLASRTCSRFWTPRRDLYIDVP